MSEVKVNKISPRSGTGVQLGDSGDTITIPAGATINNQGTATNFGATGSASWVTTVKTGDFTAVAGEGYFVNTTSGEIDVALPAGTAGAVVAVKDYLNTFDTNNCILVPNGSDKIGGIAQNSVLQIEGIAVTLVFIDSTQGWLVTDSGLQSEAPSPQFVTATGGTITTVCTNFKVHTFTGPGTFAVSNAGNCAGSNKVSYMVIAGGGGGGGSEGGGAGGAGGYREGKTSDGGYTASPIVAPDGLTTTVASFPIVVGSGGAGSPGPCQSGGTKGNVSTFSTITSTGGGFGNQHPGPNYAGGPGGSGGGGGGRFGGAGGSGNQPNVSPAQGFDGGTSTPGCTPSGIDAGGGGGGAQGAGQNGTACTSGDGGAATTSSINGTPTTRAGGGGGGNEGNHQSTTTGGGGAGGYSSTAATVGTINTGGGGGGSGTNSPGSGAQGGSGIVVIRYKFQ